MQPHKRSNCTKNASLWVFWCVCYIVKALRLKNNFRPFDSRWKIAVENVVARVNERRRRIWSNQQQWKLSLTISLSNCIAVSSWRWTSSGANVNIWVFRKNCTKEASDEDPFPPRKSVNCLHICNKVHLRRIKLLQCGTYSITGQLKLYICRECFKT